MIEKFQRVFDFRFLQLVMSHIEPLGSIKRPILLEKLLQLGSDGITNLDGGGLAADVTSASASLNNVADGLLDNASFVEHAEGVLHHHGDGEDSGNGVDDSLSGNVRSRAYYIYLISAFLPKL